MAAFDYHALTSQGESRSGTVQADSVRAARALLRQQGLIPLDARPTVLPQADQISDRFTIGYRRALNGIRLVVWTQQLAGLVGAGMALERALGMLAEDSSNVFQSRLAADLRAEVSSGASLANALKRHPREFDDTFVAVIAAGEQSGHLSQVLDRLAHELEGRDQLRQKLISASIYPLIVTCFAFLIVLFLMSYVVPQVASAFSSGNRALPALTVIMLGLSQIVKDWSVWIVVSLFAVFGVLIWARKQDDFRERTDRALLRLPLFGRMALGYNAAQFAATLAMLAGAGVPILKALHTASYTLNNRALRVDALEVLGLVREGSPLASALASRQSFPKLLITFARLGEQTGQLPKMLERAAAQMSAEVQRKALRIATLLEPLLIVVMGIIVLLIVLSVMLPIIQLNQLVK